MNDPVNPAYRLFALFSVLAGLCFFGAGGLLLRAGGVQHARGAMCFIIAGLLLVTGAAVWRGKVARRG